MKISYQTGAAALIQLSVMTALNVANAIHSTAQQCGKSSGCTSALILNLLYFMLLTVWFGAIWLLATAVQSRRSRRLALLLIAVEGIVLLVALFNAQHNTNHLGLVTSLVDAALAAWVALLAARLAWANGGRIPTARRRRRPVKDV